MGRPLKWQASPVMQKIVAQNRQGRDQEPLHWLELQNAERYAWQEARGKKGTYYRYQGVVENLFDCDGELWCGRADLHQNVRLEVRTALNDEELRDRITLAWTVMRHSHVLLSSKSIQQHEVLSGAPSRRWTDRCFVYDCPQSTSDAIAETREQVVFVADHYPDLDTKQFFHHIMNTARAIHSNEALSKLYIMPFTRTDRTTVLLHFIPILAHQITDGLTTFRWNNHFAQIMNHTRKELTTKLDALFDPEADVMNRLPPAQEALYPIRSYTPARERWHWLLTRILRHVRIPPPATFQNPLTRDQPLAKAQAFPPLYDKVLSYSQTPPLNAGNISADLYGRSVTNMRRLCKEAGISIGSGCFTLVAMVMMDFEERRHPDTALSARLPFVGSFPVNPRPFLSGKPTTGEENSCMLAFSDGVTLPFLLRDLDFAGRFRLLGRLAHRQLRQYQKRKRSVEEEVHLGSRSPSQLIPALFCSTLERMEGRMDEGMKAGVNVQGAYPARASPTLATCGISSVGDVSAILTPPKVNLDEDLPEGKDMVAEFKGMASVVRPRDGEFLVGAIGDPEHLGFLAAYDANAIDPARAAEWKRLMEKMLDRDVFGEVQAKL
ncbi:hypothetical protein OHC33_003933 [Knufia fluminis]|uniref:Uncharacterized protein n=1 Tax=Knufia fluminis TaxID=191047 RepID=A0AAN8I928_9EURO|nr:hypothetical protein OHC33_003933 [Knufia fluminis]